jgi:hypothetical protein
MSKAGFWTYTESSTLRGMRHCPLLTGILLWGEVEKTEDNNYYTTCVSSHIVGVGLFHFHSPVDIIKVPLPVHGRILRPVWLKTLCFKGSQCFEANAAIKLN